MEEWVRRFLANRAEGGKLPGKALKSLTCAGQSVLQKVHVLQAAGGRGQHGNPNALAGVNQQCLIVRGAQPAQLLSPTESPPNAGSMTCTSNRSPAERSSRSSGLQIRQFASAMSLRRLLSEYGVTW